MCRAAAVSTPRSGMAVPGSTESGSMMKSIRFSGVFGSAPAMKRRAAHSVSGGPVHESAPATPGMTWHSPQP